MYIMDISIFGLNINVEILILIGVVYLILVGHTFCGCCNFNFKEGLDNIKTTITTDLSNNTMLTQMGTGNDLEPSPAGNIISNKAKMTSTNNNGKTIESFVGANTNYGQSSPYDINSQESINTSSWSKPDLSVVPGKPLSKAVKEFLAREPQPVPLPEGEMLMFANTPFKPECCPNTYSNSSGCACMTSEMYNYLILRGGNNVPYSEY